MQVDIYVTETKIIPPCPLQSLPNILCITGDTSVTTAMQLVKIRD
jgi:hypothetical protein